MAALADYVHAKGLRLGIYSDYGTKTCGGYPGSLGHEAADAATFAKWKIDMLKVDGCNKPANASYNAGFELMGRALNATGRPILFSCSWPDYIRGGSVEANVDFKALRQTCNIWRIYNDIQDNWWHVLDIADWWGDHQGVLAPAAHS